MWTGYAYTAGFIETADEAAVLFADALRGRVPVVRQRLASDEKESISAGQVYIFHPNDDLKRWTDGKHWLDSAADGDFLVYREADISLHPETQRRVRHEKQRGLRKRTIGDKEGSNLRLVCYYYGESSSPQPPPVMTPTATSWDSPGSNFVPTSPCFTPPESLPGCRNTLQPVLPAMSSVASLVDMGGTDNLFFDYFSHSVHEDVPSHDMESRVIVPRQSKRLRSSDGTPAMVSFSENNRDKGNESAKIIKSEDTEILSELSAGPLRVKNVNTTDPIIDVEHSDKSRSLIYLDPLFPSGMRVVHSEGSALGSSASTASGGRNGDCGNDVSDESSYYSSSAQATATSAMMMMMMNNDVINHPSTDREIIGESTSNCFASSGRADFAEYMAVRDGEEHAMQPGRVANFRDGLLTTSGFECDNIITPRIISHAPAIIGNVNLASTHGGDISKPCAQVAMVGQVPIWVRVSPRAVEKGDYLSVGTSFGDVYANPPSEVSLDAYGRVVGIALGSMSESTERRDGEVLVQALVYYPDASVLVQHSIKDRKILENRLQILEQRQIHFDNAIKDRKSLENRLQILEQHHSYPSDKFIAIGEDDGSQSCSIEEFDDTPLSMPRGHTTDISPLYKGSSQNIDDIESIFLSKETLKVDDLVSVKLRSVDHIEISSRRVFVSRNYCGTLSSLTKEHLMLYIRRANPGTHVAQIVANISYDYDGDGIYDFTRMFRPVELLGSVLSSAWQRIVIDDVIIERGIVSNEMVNGNVRISIRSIGDVALLLMDESYQSLLTGLPFDRISICS